MTTSNPHNLTPTHAIAEALGTEHRAVKDRAETLLSELEASGLLAKAPHEGGFKWTLKTAHPAFPSDVVAEHGFYLNARQARYETLLIGPTMGLMLAAGTRKGHRVTQVVKLTGL